MAAIAEEFQPARNILVVFSLVPSTPAYRPILEGIRNELDREFSEDYNLYSEYLEVERYPNGSYPKERFELFNQKYDSIPLDLLICVGINAAPTIRELASSKLLDLPVVSMDIDFSGFGIPFDITLNSRTAAIGLEIDPVKSISTALSICPGTENIFFVCGVSEADRIFYSISLEAAKKFEGQQNITFLTDMSMDEAISRVRQIPGNSIIIMPSFNTDSKRVPYYIPEAIRLLSKAAKVPLFIYTGTGIGEGAIGGYLIDYSKAGKITGDAAVRVLQGKAPSSIHYTSADYYVNMFDDRQLRRFKIDRRLLPKGSVILYRENEFLARYKWIFVAGLLFLILQSLMLFRLFFLNRKQKQMTQKLRESENKFRELAREDRILSIGLMTASLSHELNQPLTAILSTAQAGLKFIETGNTDPELMKEILGNIVEDDKRTASILGSIRGMLKIEKRERERVDLNKLIEELAGICNSEARMRNVRLELLLHEVPVHTVVDPVQIQQVLLNLISNAMQAAQSLDGPNRVIRISETVEDDLVTVSVRDFGKGIDEAMREKIFKPFITSKEEGLGIGLAISRTIINNHQGRIWAENKPDGGAEFSFSLKTVK
jgi:signal transduction histidine kinase